MKPNGIIIAILSGLFAAGPVLADASPTTQPAGANLASELQLKAHEDMGRGDYKYALPLLQKASELLADQPDQLAPILEQNRVCRHQISNPTANPAVAAAPLSVAIAV